MTTLRRFCALAFATGLSSAASVCQADYFTTTVDVNGGTPSYLQRFDEETGLNLSLGDVPALSIGGGSGPFVPTDVALGPDGNLYITNLAFDPSFNVFASVLRLDGATGAPVPAPFMGLPDGVFTALPAPSVGVLSFTSLAFDSEGLLYVLDSNDVSTDGSATPGVRVYDTASGAQVNTLLESSGIFGFFSGSAFTADGDLLISDRAGARVLRVDVENDTFSEFTTTGLVGPAGIAVDAAGDVYVVDLDGNKIVKYNAAGTASETFIQFDDPLPEDETVDSIFPSDIVFDADGNLIVAVLGPENPGPDGTAAGQLLKFDPSGALIQTIAQDLRATSSVAITPDLLPGDYNGDGLVDAADYAVWRGAFGDTVTPGSGADGSGDGVVDAADYTVWRDTFGDAGIPLASNLNGAPTPEPTALVLLLAAGLLARGAAREGRRGR